ncbi:MAG: DUF4992 family lipoprotein [Prevotella sp.]|nr:DUF4992 family lipoprotein [Prevotella sp.]
MRKNHFSLRRKAYALLSFTAGVLLFTSCAQDGFDNDETFSSSVTNTTLSSPSANDISIEASTDNSKTVITWKVIYGAGGYICSVYDVTDPDAPVAVDDYENTLVDGCSIAVTREEDTNYKFSIRTAGNEELNNKEAETTTEVEFNSFTETYATIPDGSDLAVWFAQNPVPDDAVNEALCYDLEQGGNYTLSEDVDFGLKKVTLRTKNQSDHAKITYTGSSVSILTQTALTIKYVDFDCSASKAGMIELSETPDESIYAATGSGTYYNIMYSIVINGCNIDGINGNIVYDNKVAYCLENLLIKNCVIRHTSNTVASNNISFYFPGGFINDFEIDNSTLWNAGESDATYFVQYNNSGRSTRAGYTKNYVSYKNCTFYNIAKTGQMGNYSGFNGQSTSVWVMTNCIFVDCGNNQVCRRFVGGAVNSSDATFLNNTYMFDGEFESTDGSVANYDTSGTAIEEDPGFKDPTNGDFTVSGSAQIAKRTGDPRWLPEE